MDIIRLPKHCMVIFAKQYACGLDDLTWKGAGPCLGAASSVLLRAAPHKLYSRQVKRC